jgi:hypothetical protein
VMMTRLNISERGTSLQSLASLAVRLPCISPP